MCAAPEYGFSAIFVRNKVLILTILASNRVWFLHSSPELRRFFFFFSEEAIFFKFINLTGN